MAEPRGFQYAGPAHESSTARAGMWLFIASEILFFGALVYVWTVLRLTHPGGVALGTDHANLLIGSVNTALLLTSSLVLTIGVLRARQATGQDDDPSADRAAGRAVAWCCLGAAALGLLFLLMKGLEWGLDLHEGLFPGSGFALTGPYAPGAQLFFSFYWIATALHGVHMIIGLGLLLWLSRLGFTRPMRGRHVTAVEVVGLYWSFVDTVWLVLYPLIYLVARP